MKKTRCIWPKCRKLTYNWFCQLHYLTKEADYGYGDTDPEKKWKNKKTKEEFYSWGVKRLRNFFEYVIQEKII
jgi:hypothetical protein